MSPIPKIQGYAVIVDGRSAALVSHPGSAKLVVMAVVQQPDYVRGHLFSVTGPSP